MKPKPYHSYKDSGIEWLGEVPEHWKVNRLKLHIKLNPSKKEISHFSKDTELSFIPMDNVGIDGSLVLDTVKPLFEVDSGYTYFREHDVAIAKITPCFENGKGCIFSNLTSGHGFGTTELTVMRPLNINPKYLYYITSSYSFKRIGESSMQGSAGQKRVPDEFIKEFRSPIPSIQEQRSIASFLDHEKARIDTLIQKKEQMIELLKEKRIALITQAVTKGLDPNVKMKDSGIDWLGEVPEHWLTRKVGMGYSIQLGKMLQPKPNNPLDTTVKYLKAINVQWEDITADDDSTMWASEDEIHKYKVQKGDLLVCEGGEAGRAAILENDVGVMIIQNALHRVRSSSNDVRYLLYVLRVVSHQGWFDILCNKATIAHFTRDKFSELCIPYPPRKEQEKIVSHIQNRSLNINKAVEHLYSSISLLHEYRSSLIHSAVTGKIDLRGYNE